MQQLNLLVAQAQALGANAAATAIDPAVGEVARILQICNACRYCEGFCAVFPAMTRRLTFSPSDIHYLANLCHNCGACLHACQYAPPHEFGVNVPQSLAVVRKETYIEYAWPKFLGVLYQKNGITLALASSLALIFFLVLTLAANGNLISPARNGNFYAVFSHNTLAYLFSVTFLFALLALGIGVRRFWQSISPGGMGAARLAASAEAAHDTFTLKYLGGGHGEGCNNADDGFSLWRKRFHHYTFYGFCLCFAATSVATLYHYVFGWQAPYAIISLPVILGTLGGIGLVIGPLGLLCLNFTRATQHGDASQKPMDRGFILLLLLISVSGLLLLAYRETAAMAILLAAHLGFVMAFFLTMPYSKFAHGVYRVAALLKNSVEKRQANNLMLGSE
jgi:citrate/tricarballylate utilization protein